MNTLISGSYVHTNQHHLGQAVLNKERARQLWNQASRYIQRGAYRRAIIRFERLRQLPGMTEVDKNKMLYNIGTANLRLRRFATAIFYFETYLKGPGINEQQKIDAEKWMQKAMQGAGIRLQ